MIDSDEVKMFLNCERKVLQDMVLAVRRSVINWPEDTSAGEEMRTMKAKAILDQIIVGAANAKVDPGVTLDMMTSHGIIKLLTKYEYPKLRFFSEGGENYIEVDRTEFYKQDDGVAGMRMGVSSPDGWCLRQVGENGPVNTYHIEIET